MSPSRQCTGSGLVLSAPVGTELLRCPECGVRVPCTPLEAHEPAQSREYNMVRLRGHQPA